NAPAITRTARSSDTRQAELAAPAREQPVAQSAVRRLAQLGVARDDVLGLAARLFEDRAVAQQVGHAELGQSGLARAEEIAGAADLEVDLRDLEAVGRADHRVDPALRVLAEPPAGHENGVGRPLPAPDAPAELVQLR